MPIFEVLYKRYPALSVCRESIESTFEVLKNCYTCGGKVLLCGNGGSAADAEHIVGELMKGFHLSRSLTNSDREILNGIAGKDIASRIQGALPAISMNSHAALASAILNDTCAQMIFAQQVYGLGNKDDVLWGISTSGNSENIMNAFSVARFRQMKTILLTGQSGGKIASLADVAIRVPADCVAEIQEYHLPVYHALCAGLEQEFFH
jgi:D-sedoheptulose 7-phosphate isomerase